MNTCLEIVAVKVMQVFKTSMMEGYTEKSCLEEAKTKTKHKNHYKQAKKLLQLMSKYKYNTEITVYFESDSPFFTSSKTGSACKPQIPPSSVSRMLELKMSTIMPGTRL